MIHNMCHLENVLVFLESRYIPLNRKNDQKAFLKMVELEPQINMGSITKKSDFIILKHFTSHKNNWYRLLIRDKNT